MMILRTTPPSPFGRKAVIAASVLGLSDQIKIEPADPTNPSDTLLLSAGVSVQAPAWKDGS